MNKEDRVTAEQHSLDKSTDEAKGENIILAQKAEINFIHIKCEKCVL